MAKGRDKSIVSIWFWLISMVVLAIPLVNIIMTIVWAFTGENETRKNYFKAVIVMFFVVTGLMVFFMGLSVFPALFDQFVKATQ